MEWLENLKAMKSKRNLTTREIAELSAIPEPTLEKLFAGQTKDPKLGTIQAVVHSLGFTLDDLEPMREINSSLVPQKSKTEEIWFKELTDNWIAMNDAGRNELLKHSRLLLRDNQYLACDQFGLEAPNAG